MDGARSRGIPPRDAITGGFSDGADFFTYILAGLLIGLLLDWWTGWSPVLTIIWSFMGIGVGSWRMWVHSQSIEDDAEGISHGV
jgi:F0F1-type ATP synthase assembly protein I